MKRAFKLEGLNCANCAEKIEREIKALEGVNFASVNFMTSKMVIEGDDARFDDIVKAAQRIVTRYEPDVVSKEGLAMSIEPHQKRIAEIAIGSGLFLLPYY
ncbi:cation transporter [Acetomicrobium sp.]|uniref:cation transporter n=1 Tax=Acetomicrobium sp. TaxID=1872099 RepID=UPI002FC8EEF4